MGSRGVESGSIEVFGRLIKPSYGRVLRRSRARTGGVGGIFSLIPSYTVAENICYPLMLAGERKKTVKERLLKMLTEFSLLKQASEYPSSLTRVEKTLVQFARASIANQPLMIIDEPMAGLDQTTFDRISQYLVKVSLSGRSMIILTSEKWSRDLPNTDIYNIENGELV
jgi:cell division transport system ATP-binding protein